MLESNIKSPGVYINEVVGTPEGDNEFPPDQPLHPVPENAEQDPRGAEPIPYKQDHD